MNRQYDKELPQKLLSAGFWLLSIAACLLVCWFVFGGAL